LRKKAKIFLSFVVLDILFPFVFYSALIGIQAECLKCSHFIFLRRSRRFVYVFDSTENKKVFHHWINK